MSVMAFFIYIGLYGETFFRKNKYPLYKRINESKLLYDDSGFWFNLKSNNIYINCNIPYLFFAIHRALFLKRAVIYKID